MAGATRRDGVPAAATPATPASGTTAAAPAAGSTRTSFVVAQFLQHDSRDKDPQLHVHQAILNRILCADGEWRSLDSRAIHTLRAAAGAIAERVMEAHLTRSLGVEFATRPDGQGPRDPRRPAGGHGPVLVPAPGGDREDAELIADFRDANGREPTPAERYYIAQQATLATRAGKSHDGETRAEQIARWTEQCRATVARRPRPGRRATCSPAPSRRSPAASWSPRDVVARALAGGVGDQAGVVALRAGPRGLRRAAGQPARRPRAGRAPAGRADRRGVGAGRTASPQADDTTNLPASELLANGQSPYTSPDGRALHDRGPVHRRARRPRAAPCSRGAATLPAEVADRLLERYAESGVTLGDDQAAALRGVLTSGAQVEVLWPRPGHRQVVRRRRDRRRLAPR